MLARASTGGATKLRLAGCSWMRRLCAPASAVGDSGSRAEPGDLCARVSSAEPVVLCPESGAEVGLAVGVGTCHGGEHLPDGEALFEVADSGGAVVVTSCQVRRGGVGRDLAPRG